MEKDIRNIRVLCADMIEKAKSGHPGSALGLTQFMYILYTEFINLNPDDPKDINRDIVVMSNGHACSLQYVLNYFLGYIEMDDLKLFRQLNSKTPGHPEKNNYGVDIATGPLGQGVASALGFAISSKILSNYGCKSKVYCIFGDGCYQEGISHETFSLCSKLKLDNIVFIYDYNKFTIDGSTNLSMDENVRARFESLNFDVIEITDNVEEIRSALSKNSEKPKIIILHTKTGKDSNFENTQKAHGTPFSCEDVEDLKSKYELPLEKFYVSEHLKETFENVKIRMRNYFSSNNLIKNINCEKLKNLLNNYYKGIINYEAFYKNIYKSKDLPTRMHMHNCLNDILTNQILINGSADLSSSIMNKIENTEEICLNKFGLNSYINYGIREHAMFGVMNGIAAHGIFLPIGSTFLAFSTYGLGAIRMACIDNLKVIYLFCHDTIKMGEDGPTHQPIEELAILRSMHNLVTLRPCDGRETRSALAIALKEKGPVAIILTKQKVSELSYTEGGSLKYCSLNNNISESDVEKGAYFLHREENHEIILIATGSEVELAFKIKENMKDKRISIVSMISFELFERQKNEYKFFIIDNKALKISLEALSTFGWAKYTDIQIGLDSYGVSAPGEDAYAHFGFVPEKIANKIRLYLEK